MNTRIEINSIAVNKLKDNHDNFIKYDIDVSLDETENTETGIKLKYKIVLLSNPTNTKLTIEGLASLFGNDLEISKQLEPDQKNIPMIVNVIYQEIFPLIFVISKSLQIPCPAYKLSQISSSIPQEIKPEEIKPEEIKPEEIKPEEIKPEETTVKEPTQQITDDNTDGAGEIKVEQIELPSEDSNEPIIQEANVSSI